MTNAQKNIAFFTTVDSETKDSILKNIANHYGITPEEAYKEVTDDEAEHLFDYVTGDERVSFYQKLSKK